MSVSLNYIGLQVDILTDEEPLVVQYIYYDDGVEYWRKGVRGGVYVLDHVLGGLGFYGPENIDWENVWSIS